MYNTTTDCCTLYEVQVLHIKPHTQIHRTRTYYMNTTNIVCAIRVDFLHILYNSSTSHTLNVEFHSLFCIVENIIRQKIITYAGVSQQ